MADFRRGRGPVRGRALAGNRRAHQERKGRGCRGIGLMILAGYLPSEARDPFAGLLCDLCVESSQPPRPAPSSKRRLSIRMMTKWLEKICLLRPPAPRAGRQIVSLPSCAGLAPQAAVLHRQIFGSAVPVRRALSRLPPCAEPGPGAVPGYCHRVEQPIFRSLGASQRARRLTQVLAQATAPAPFLSITSKSLAAGPLGDFTPRSHCATALELTPRKAAKTG